MNSLERIRATIGFQPADRPPVIPQLFAHSATVAGHSVGEYVRNGKLAARCQIRAWEQYGHDTVFALLDACVEAEALGAQVTFRERIYPAVTVPPFQADTVFDDLTPPDPHSAARMPEVLAAAAELRTQVGDEVLVVSCVQGPMTLALQSLGVEKALYLAADEPERFMRLLDFTTATALRFGIAQIEAGAHTAMIFEPGACPEVVPPAFFRELIKPRLTQLCSAFKHAGAAATWLHIAGNTQAILSHYPDIGVDIANFDYPVTPAAAMSALPHTCLDGNLKPLAFVDAPPAAVESAARELLAAFAERGGYILSSGCEIPPEATPENVAALVGAVR